MDFIKWTFLIYCLSVGSYLMSFSGWSTVPYDWGMIQAGNTTISTLNQTGSIIPVAGVFGWELVKAFTMLITLVVAAPIYFGIFLMGIFPVWLDFLAVVLTVPLGILYYIGIAQFLLRMRGEV